MASAIEQGRAAYAANQWGDAWRLLAEVDSDTLDVDDLDRLATAAYLIGHDEEAFTHWGRAYQLSAAEGSVHRAASIGAKLAQGLAFKGDLARCHGWVERVTRLLEDADIDCIEQGYLEYGQAMIRLFEHGDIAGAQALFGRAGKTAARFAHRELGTLARIGVGRMVIYLGDIAEGMAMLDEAMVSIEAGELSALATGDAYCTVIDACSELSDIARCRAWSESFVRWCDMQQDLVLYRGHCFLHRAEVLGVLGAWEQALDEARRACDRLAAPVQPIALAMACIIEGDLLRLAGDLGGAEQSYRRASEIGRDPQPGLALVRLAQDRADSAEAMIRRALDEAEDPISRVRLLGAYIEIMLAAGDVAAAQTAIEELRDTAARIGTPLLRAQADRAAGSVALANGDPKPALVALRKAFNQMQELGARFEAAHARLLLAEACRAIGDLEAAEMEAAAGHAVFDSLRGPAPLPHGLTQREVDVLILLARGKTNRVIAEELFISEKTVASHVSHIFTKAGVSSRSAATAYAYDEGLIDR